MIFLQIRKRFSQIKRRDSKRFSQEEQIYTDKESSHKKRDFQKWLQVKIIVCN